MIRFKAEDRPSVATLQKHTFFSQEHTAPEKEAELSERSQKRRSNKLVLDKLEKLRTGMPVTMTPHATENASENTTPDECIVIMQ